MTYETNKTKKQTKKTGQVKMPESLLLKVKRTTEKET